MAELHDHVIGFSPNSKEDLSNARLYGLVSKYLLNGFIVIYAAESLVSSPFRGEQDRIKIQQEKQHRVGTITSIGMKDKNLQRIKTNIPIRL